MERPEFKDRQLVCQDCGKSYTFESGEQFFFWVKGLSEPKRCPECRQKRKLTIRPPEAQHEG